ncbi:MAG: peptide chain release factor 2 [Actinobacteria bacterium]|nr:MAG: peptide chain release factor 2 [Actinomycetota bacterium]
MVGDRSRALATIAGWPTKAHSRSSSSSRRSGPSSAGSVITFDPDALRTRATGLEQEMGEPGFWDDQQHAAQVSSEHARLTRRLDRYDRLQRDYDDATELLAMDGDLAGELEASIRPLRAELERLQEDALFTGEYDAGDAVVTIHAGEGGTDAQDWAEILLRMYLRWAERRGFKAELVEASPGEEYGLKSAKRGVHRLVRLSPFDQAHRRHTSFAQVIVAPLLADDIELDIKDDDLRIDTYRASGAGGQHVNKTDSAVRITHVPTGIVVQCQNERSQAANKDTAMKILRSRLAERLEEEREEELAKERGAVVSTGFGSQIRSYVLHPYQLVKDLRTDYEVGNAQGVLDGDLDGFIRAYLLSKATGNVL